MVKERKAFSTDVISITPPSEKLKVPERETVDLSSTMMAQNAKNGVFLNPELMNDVRNMSDYFAGTARFAEMQENETLLQEYSLSLDTALAKEKDIVERNAASRLSDLNIQMTTDLMQAQKEAEALGEDGGISRATLGLRERYLKMADDMYADSPVLSTAFKKDVQDVFSKGYASALLMDDKLSQIKLKAGIDTSANTLFHLYLTTETMSFDAMLDRLGSNVAKSLAKVSTEEKEEIANKLYRDAFKTEMLKIAHNVQLGVLTPNEGMAAAASTYVKYGKYSLKGEDLEGNPKEFDVTLDENAYKAAVDVITSAKTLVANSGVITDINSYKEMAQSEDYLNYTTVDNSKAHYTEIRSRLVNAASAGNKTASKNLNELDNIYWGQVRPYIVVSSIIRTAYQDGKDVAKVKAELVARSQEAREWLRRGEYDKIDSLFYGNEAGYISAAFPSNDSDFMKFLAKQGDMTSDQTYMYYKNVIDMWDKALNTSNNMDGMALRDPELGNKIGTLKGLFGDYSQIVRVTDRGDILVNRDGVLNLAANLKGTTNYVKGLKAGHVNSTSSALMDTILQTANGLDAKHRSVYLEGLAEAITMAGASEFVTLYKLPKDVGDGQKAIAKDLAAMVFLSADSSLGHLKDAYIKNMIEGKVSNPTVSTVNSFLDQGSLLINTEGGGGDVSSELEYYRNKYRITSEFWPAVESTLLNVLVSQGYDERGEKKEVDAGVIDQILRQNFTNKGSYIYSSAFEGMNIVEIDELRSEFENDLKKVNKELNIEGLVNTQVSSENNTFTLFVGGRRLEGFDKNGNVIPYTFILPKGKPDGVSDATYNRAISRYITGAATVSALSEIKYNTPLQDKVAKAGYTPEEVVAWSNKVASVLLQPTFAQDYMQFLQSGGANTKLMSAPKEFKNLLLTGTVGSEDIFSEVQDAREKRIMERHGYIPGKSIIKNTKGYSKEEEQFIDFVYSRMQNGVTMRGDISTEAHNVAGHFPLSTISQQVESCGNNWYVTAAKETEGHVEGSLHGKGRAVDIGIRGGFFNCLDPYNRIKKSAMDDLYNGFIKPMYDQGNITKVLTGHQDVVDRFKHLKTPDGKQIFQYAEDHKDHFHVEFAHEYTDADGKKLVDYSLKDIEIMATNIYNNLNDGQGLCTVSMPQSRAGVRLFSNYEPNKWDETNTGRSKKELTSSPVLRAQTATLKIVQGKNVFGSMNMAVAGMHGAKFKLIPINPSLVRPDKTFTMEEAIDVHKKVNFSRNDVLWQLVGDPKKYEKYINEYAEAGR